MSKLERFKKYLKDTYPHPIDEYREAALWHLWQAALSTRKPYGWGIVGPKGPAFGVVLTENGADDHMRAYKQAGRVGYRKVELFYEDSES